MIKLFRNVRQRILKENRFSRYLLYAMGEIILVVIGILIALQINNSNRISLDRKFEKTMLREIKKSLQIDLRLQKHLKDRAYTIDSGIQELLGMIESDSIYPDTTLLRVYNKMGMAMQFNYSRGAYEGLRSSGLDKISNDSLRNKLIQTNETDLPRLNDLFEYAYNDNSSESDYQLQLHNSLWKRIVIHNPDGRWKIVSRPKDGNSFLKQPELVDRIKIAQDNLGSFMYRLNDVETVITECLKSVEKELSIK
ncbi:MAG: DUF6090 family protein [Gelidibacter sp.]